MSEYTVLYFEHPMDHACLKFVCMAEDEEHAEWLMLNSNPRAIIAEIRKGNL